MTVRQSEQPNGSTMQISGDQDSVPMQVSSRTKTAAALPCLCIFLDHMDYGGAQRVMLNLANGFAARGYPVDLVLVRARGDYLQQVAPEINVVDLASTRALLSTPKLAAYLRRARPAVVLTGMYTNTIALWARKIAGVRTRVIISLHNTLSVEQSFESTNFAALKGKFERSFYSWADGIIAVSNGVADDFVRIQNMPTERVKTIYNPVITPDIRRRAAIRVDHPWLSSGSPPLILGIGRLSLQKDFSNLIRAFAIVKREMDANLLILGEGPERPNLEGLIRELCLEDSVQLPGTIDNPYSYLTQAALFVLSSAFEGLPTVLIEALFCGASVVATDCPSGPYEILAGGRYGRLVPINDSPSLAATILDALMSDQPSPSAESWSRFELDVVVDEYLAYMLPG